jgi:hypothetical protein
MKTSWVWIPNINESKGSVGGSGVNGNIGKK